MTYGLNDSLPSHIVRMYNNSTVNIYISRLSFLNRINRRQTPKILVMAAFIAASS